MLNPDTITPEGLKLLAEAFMRRELRMGEDRVCCELCSDEDPILRGGRKPRLAYLN